MTAGLTGRSVLKYLHMHGGETQLATLASTLGADPAGIERLILSLSAAKLVCRTTDLLALSEAGRVWCSEEFKSNAGGSPTPAVITPPASMDAPMSMDAPIRSGRSASGQSLISHKTNRMQGVQVVRMTRRREQLAKPTAIASESAPARDQESEGISPIAVAGETADPVSEPAAPRPEPCDTESTASGVVVDKAGFVTHIKGRKIF